MSWGFYITRPDPAHLIRRKIWNQTIYLLVRFSIVVGFVNDIDGSACSVKNEGYQDIGSQ